MNHPQTKRTIQTPKEIKLVAYLAFATMVVLSSAALKVLLSAPQVITNTSREVVVLPNDTVLEMRNEIAVLRTQVADLEHLAAVRAQVINQLASPMQQLTDSLLALSRAAVSYSEENSRLLDAADQQRTERFNALSKDLGEIKSDLPALRNLLLEQQQPEPPPAETLVHDTVYAALPDPPRRSWLSRLFRPKK